MNHINNQHIALLQIGEQRHKVALLLNRRSARHPNIHAHFMRNNIRQRRLTKPGRPIKQHMIQRLLPQLRRININLQALLRLALSDILIQRIRPQTPLPLRIFRRVGRVYYSVLIIRVVKEVHFFCPF